MTHVILDIPHPTHLSLDYIPSGPHKSDELSLVRKFNTCFFVADGKTRASEQHNIENKFKQETEHKTKRNDLFPHRPLSILGCLDLKGDSVETCTKLALHYRYFGLSAGTCTTINCSNTT